VRTATIVLQWSSELNMNRV